ncbi:MAG: MarR family transcriptional regulator [Pseudomonadota bacterium]
MDQSQLSQDERVLVALRQIIRATALSSRQLNKKVGLTSPQLLVLQAIQELGAVALSRLAGSVSLSQATVTTIIDRLEARGLVERRRSTVDKRVVHAALTASGCAMLDAAPRPLQDVFSARFADLEEWEQAMIVAAFQRVASMMNAENIDASPVLHVGGAVAEEAPPTSV